MSNNNNAPPNFNPNDPMMQALFASLLSAAAQNTNANPSAPAAPAVSPPASSPPSGSPPPLIPPHLAQLAQSLAGRMGGRGGDAAAALAALTGAAGGAGGSGGHEELIDVTSDAQFRDILSKNAAVVVDFWSPRCPPCLKIKPIFAEMAKTYKNAGLVCCAINTTVSAVGGPITRIPTFHFYFNGQKVDEMVGAHVEQLQSKIHSLLEMSSKSHKHHRLSFTHFRPDMAPPVLFDTGKVDLIVKKLKSFAEPRGLLDSESALLLDECATAISAISVLPVGASKSTVDFPIDTLSVLDSLAVALPEQELFPLLDLLRIALLHPDCNAYYAQQRVGPKSGPSNPSNKEYNLILYVIRACYLAVSTSSVDPSAPSFAPLKASHMVSMKLASNLFAHKPCITLVSSSLAAIDLLLESASAGLRLNDKNSRISSAAVLHNIRNVTAPPPPRSVSSMLMGSAASASSSSSSTVCTSSASLGLGHEAALEMMSALCHVLEEERDEEVLYASLMAASRWIYADDGWESIAQSLVDPASLRSKVATGKVASIAQDFVAMITST
eukprot:GILI01009403.1.p1 GENE.GILI01009403.1~~GILI01009403.1.p1  ORF type:complete len:554 (+),score=153.85 GILI01009403.1:88-1749(+)